MRGRTLPPLAPVLLLLFLHAPGAAEGAEAGAPPNDDRADAERVDVLFRAHAARLSTAGATTEEDEPRPCSVGATVWFRMDLEGGALGHVRVDTLGSDFSTVLAVYREAPGGALDLVACNDHAPGLGRDAELLFTAVPGETYLLQAGGYNGGVGTLQVNVRGGTPALPPGPVPTATAIVPAAAAAVPVVPAVVPVPAAVPVVPVAVRP